MNNINDCDEHIQLRQRRKKSLDACSTKSNNNLEGEKKENHCTNSSLSLQIPCDSTNCLINDKPSTSDFDSSEHLNIVLNNEKQHLSLQSQNQLLLTEAKQLSPKLSHFESDKLVKPKKLGILEFIDIELTRGYSLHQEEVRYTEKRRKVYAFVRIPFELEKFLFYGFLQCLDSFCHIFTFLPTRILISLFGYIARIKIWTPADTCDLLKIVIIIAASWFMQSIDTSALYHLVRGQGIIKLYIFYNMLEVLDKLLSSFGQDILDALLWTASERSRKRRKFFMLILHLSFAIAYAFSHAILVLLQAITLNVAFFNIHNNSLLTIMMSNNFVELKGSVFKKFTKPNLFQMACSDVRERFHIVILLIVVVLRIMTAVSWDFNHLNEMLPNLTIVIIAEYIVDWLKHAFITKFNEISPEVYQDFTITLAFDVVRCHDKNSFSDFSDQVSRRMGFIPVPLSIMLIRVITQLIDFKTNSYIYIFLIVWFALLTIKIIAGVFLHSQAVDQVIYYQNLQTQAKNEIYRQRMLSQKSKSAPGSPRLSLIDFTDVLTQTTHAPKTFTASDMLAHLDEISASCRREPSESKIIINENSTEPPRRSQSLVNFNDNCHCRKNFTQPSIPEGEERCNNNDENVTLSPSADIQLQTGSIFRRDNSARVQVSPKKRILKMECESLSGVQAYTLLNSSEQFQT